MNKTRYLQLQFDQPFQAFDIPKLRAAIIEKTKRESDLFHNHLGDDKFLYRYPLIQYKIKNKKPCLICLREATDDIHFLLKEKDFSFTINGKIYDFEIEDVRLRYVNIQTWDTDFVYNVLHYLALNQEHYIEYKKLNGMVDKVVYLQDVLAKHLKLFANELKAHLPYPITCKLINILEEKFIEYKEVFHLAFTLEFTSNLYLPDLVGLGKGVSVGFGKVRMLNRWDD